VEFIGEPVTRRREQYTGTDRYGNPVFSLVDVVLDDRAAFDPGGSREPVEVGREQTITTPKLFFPDAWPDLVATDRVVVRAEEYMVLGVPPSWRDPWGSTFGGLVVELERVEG